MVEKYQQELIDKQRQLETISKDCSDCLRKEQELRKIISDYQEKIARDKEGKDRFARSTLSRYETELTNVLRRHQALERKRGQLLTEIQRTQNSIEFWQRERNESQKRKAKEKAEQEKRRQRREAEAAAYKEKQAALATSSSKVIKQEKSINTRTKKRHPILFLLIILLLVGRCSNSHESGKLSEDTKGSSNMGTSQGDGTDNESISVSDKYQLAEDENLSEYIGLTVENIESVFGTDYIVGWGIHGGYEMVYENGAASFLFNGYENQDFSVPEKSNIIYGVSSSMNGRHFTDAIYIGMSHDDLAEATAGNYDTYYDSEKGGEGIYINDTELLQGLAEIYLSDSNSNPRQYRIITVEIDGYMAYISMIVIDGAVD